MTVEEYLNYIRNHATEVKETLSYIDATFNSVNEGYVEVGVPALKNVIGGAYDGIITKVTAMKDALDELE